jgi:hypothetical protein
VLAHLSGKTNKQIRDKRKEQTYKNLLKAQMDTENVMNNNTNTSTREESNSPYTDPPELITPEIQEPSLDTPENPLDSKYRPSETEVEELALNTSIRDSHWITKECKVFLEHTTYILGKIRATGELPPQNTIDKVYSELVTLIQPTQSKTRKNPRPNKGVREKNVKRRRKRYLYGRSKEVYKKNKVF